jgi:Type IV secretion-system coupling protein DNA-binding domain
MRRFPQQDRSSDQHTAYSVAAWHRRADVNGSVSQFVHPALDPQERKWAGTITVLGVGMLWSFRRQGMRRNLGDDGRRLKGPQIITVKEFNRWSRAVGIGFSTTTRGEMVCILRSFESSHMMIMGDSGTGKSALQRQLLMQIRERREKAIVYDPALEYAPQFYRPERGDVILNPLGVRCPYWSPSDEVVHEAEALTLATSSSAV